MPNPEPKRISLSVTVHIGLLLLVLCFHHVNNFILLKRDCGQFATGDERIQRINPLFYYSIFTGKQGKVDYSNRTTQPNHIFMAMHRTHWPPFPFMISAVSCILFNLSVRSLLLPATFCFLLLLIATYGIGRRVFNPTTGLLAAALLGFFPLVNELSRVLKGDIFMAAFIAASLFLLMDPRLFEKRSHSVLLGVTMGLGMLSLGAFPLYFFAPALALAWTSYRSRGEERCSHSWSWPNVALTILIAAGLASTFYFPGGLKRFLTGFFEDSARHRSFLANNWLDTGPFFYLKSLVFQQVSWPVFLFLLPGIPFLFRIRIRRPHLLMLALWFLVPFAFFSMSPLKYHRYMLATTPVPALLAAAGLRCIPLKVLRIVLIGATVAVSLFMNLSFSYSIPSSFQDTILLFKSNVLGSTGLPIVHEKGRGEEDICRVVDRVYQIVAENSAGTAAIALFDDPTVWNTYPFEERIFLKSVGSNAPIHVYENAADVKRTDFPEEKNIYLVVFSYLYADPLMKPSDYSPMELWLDENLRQPLDALKSDEVMKPDIASLPSDDSLFRSVHAWKLLESYNLDSSTPPGIARPAYSRFIIHLLRAENFSD